MSREVRKVAVGWQHPRLNDELYVPLMDGSKFFTDLQMYEENSRMWERGMVRDLVNKQEWLTRGEAGVCTTCFYQYYGTSPKMEDYMPLWGPEEATHFMLYESITRGTPLSPGFASEEELAEWCVSNNITMCPTRRLTLTGWLKLFHGSSMGQLMRERINTVLVEEPVVSLA